MTQKSCRRYGLIIACLFAGLLLLGGSGPATAQSGCVSGLCHEALLKGKDVHPATESCDNCHETVTTPHPQKGKQTFKLTQVVPDLCANCHDPFGGKKTIHPPAKEGQCTSCHDPHSSNEAKLLVQPAGKLCETCHQDKVDFKVLHGPVSAGDCTSCHTPHESDTTALLVTEGQALCLGCHQDMESVLKKKNPHPALEQGCTSCHNPHGSAFPKLLPADGAEVCYQCHSDISNTVQQSLVAHKPIQSKKACASCHNPHASDQAKLLLQPAKDLCLDCHKNVITADMTVLHDPIQQGHCESCHSPHGSPFARLLIREFPDQQYVPYTDTEYQLCFGCHNRDLLAFPDTSFATGFRDGERNLHYLHVNSKVKGRSCTLCHSVHGADNKELIARSVPFGKWSLPLNYVPTENGGTCTPGCHRRLSYGRKRGSKQ